MLRNRELRLPCRWPAACSIAALLAVSTMMIADRRPAKPAASHSWQGHWIWASTKNIAPHPNQFVRFRKEFSLNDVPSSATIRILADSRYHLFLNGALVGRGPTREPVSWGYYDTFGVEKLLHPGKNTIAVEVRWFGAAVAGYREPPGVPPHGGLLCQLDYATSSGRQTVGTDDSWLASEDDTIEWKQPRMNGALPEIEVVHAERADADWTQPGFDSRHWSHAQLTTTQFGLSTSPADPFAHLAPHPMDHPIEQRIAPQGIYSTGLTKGSAVPIADLGKLMATEPHDDAPHLIENGNALLGSSGSGTATLASHSAPVYVIFDLGKEVDGNPQLILDAPAQTTIDLGWSERLTGGHVRPDESGGNHVARYYARKGRQSWTLWESHSLRYLELRFAPSNHALEFRLDVLLSTANLPHKSKRLASPTRS